MIRAAPKRSPHTSRLPASFSSDRNISSEPALYSERKTKKKIVLQARKKLIIFLIYQSIPCFQKIAQMAANRCHPFLFLHLHVPRLQKYFHFIKHISRVLVRQAICCLLKTTPAQLFDFMWLTYECCLIVTKTDKILYRFFNPYTFMYK